MANGCSDCAAEGLLRVLAVRDVLDGVLWAATPPLEGVEGAIRGLQNARRFLLAAGSEPEDRTP